MPDRVQPRLRALEHGHQHDDAGPEHDRPVGHDQRPAGDVHVQAADLPGRPERPGRSRPAGARRVEHEPGQRDQPEPARLRADRHRRRPAGRAVPGEQARDHAVGADPGRHGLHGRGQLHRPPGRPRRRRRPHRGLVPQQQPGRRRRLRDHRAGRLDGLDAAQQPPDRQADVRVLDDDQLGRDATGTGRTAISNGRLVGFTNNAAGRELPRPARARGTGSRRSRSRTTWSRTASATTR